MLFRKCRFLVGFNAIGCVFIACVLFLLVRRRNVNDFPQENSIEEILKWEASLSWIPPRQHRSKVDCVRLFNSDPDEHIKAAHIHINNPKKQISERKYIKKSSNCPKFITKNDYHMSPPVPEEEDFPLAFSILVFTDVELFERLLRAIYRPQNFYCIHIDKKSQLVFHSAVKGISKCFDNVFVLEQSVDVDWGKFSVLEPDILCMQALLKYKKWKYFINLTGQEFPLKTNWELVQILKAINGSNLVEATTADSNPERFEGVPPPPLGVTPYKGAVHILARREFVDYAINSENGTKILNWVKLVDHASEYFFSTLNHNPQLGIPGSYLGIPETSNTSVGYPFINRYKLWEWDEGLVCHGMFSHSICIFGVGDLPYLENSVAPFANKFHLDYQPLALDCLEELIWNRTTAEVNGRREFDTSYYKNLHVSWNHI